MQHLDLSAFGPAMYSNPLITFQQSLFTCLLRLFVTVAVSSLLSGGTSLSNTRGQNVSGMLSCVLRSSSYAHCCRLRHCCDGGFSVVERWWITKFKMSFVA